MITQSNGPESHPMHIDPVQHTFSRILVWHAQVALSLLVITFAAYAVGLLPSGITLDEVPDLWHLSAEAYAEETNRELGWAWLSTITDGRTVVFAALVLFPGGTVVLAGILVALYLRHRVRAYALIAFLELIVLLLAATGILTRGT